jgi:hypothetical protein
MTGVHCAAPCTTTGTTTEQRSRSDCVSWDCPPDGGTLLAGLPQACSCLRLNAQSLGKLLRLIGGPRPATEKSWTPCCGSVMRTATQHESRTGPLSCHVTHSRARERRNVRADCAVCQGHVGSLAQPLHGFRRRCCRCDADCGLRHEAVSQTGLRDWRRAGPAEELVTKILAASLSASHLSPKYPPLPSDSHARPLQDRKG